jgi:hypothetical protein
MQVARSEGVLIQEQIGWLLYAGKMHALLCRRWKNRVKGRDWYDFVWFVANHPQLHLAHLRERMIQSGHWPEGKPLTEGAFRKRLGETIETVDLSAAKKKVSPFVAHPESLAVWSPEFFRAVAGRVEIA